MELQGKKKKTRDFLSLYSKDSPFQLHDSRPSPQGFLLKTHDFLHPLETAEEEKATRGTTERTAPSLVHVLPGGIGTYTISHVSTTVKPEAGTCDAPPTGYDPARKPDSSSYAFTLWDAASAAAKDTGGQQWPSPFAAARSPPSFGSFPSCRSSQFQDTKRFMESSSRFSKGFEDDDDDDDEFGKREGSAHKELTVRVDGKSGEQKASTPRSKHSATEQRRRSKINDRFQILRGLLPNSDQKRDKASFLLEVIEYIQFLQEKVHKYESMYPGWSDETTKLMPWVKVYFRSFWKNSRNHHHGSGDGLADPQVLKNGVASALLVSDNGILVTPSILPSAQNPTESDLIAGISYKVMENPSGFANKVGDAPASLQSNLYPSVGRATGVSQPQQRLITEADSMASQSEWLRSSFSADCTVSNDVINEQEELTIDEGTISVSTAYSQGLLNTLSQALQNSGIDLSQANISVHINLGRRTSGSRQNASTSMATPKDQDEPLSSNLAMRPARAGSRIDESEQASKRHKSDHS